MGFFDRLFGGSASQPEFEFKARELTGTGNYDIAAVGESRYQDALWSGIGGHRPGRVRVYVRAVLVREPENEYDPEAVAVHVSGSAKVGYLSRDDAPEYGEPLDELARDGYVGSCDAVIVGGGTYDDGRPGMLGIWLDLADPESVLLPRTQREPAAGRRPDSTSTGTSRAVRGGAGEYLGKHYTEYVDDVKALKRYGVLDKAAVLLRALIEAVEAEAAAEGIGVAPWYYEQLAIVLRKQKDFEGEVEILERYARVAHAPGVSEDELLERLPKARAKLEKSRGE